MWSCGGRGPVSETAARPIDNECSSVGRTQLSDTGVGDELTVVGQVTQGVAGHTVAILGLYLANLNVLNSTTFHSSAQRHVRCRFVFHVKIAGVYV